MARAGLRDFLLLTRAPLALTAVADGLTGYLLATVHRAREVEAHWEEVWHEPASARDLALTALASASLYLAGMALNDYFDRERDKGLAPNRPIPSGRVAPGLALGLGLLLLASGVAAAFVAGGPRAALAAGVVAGFVLAYDGFLKRWRVPGAAGMALCRAANVALGAAVGAASGLSTTGATTLPQKHALAIGTYVFALTILSTLEDEDAPRAGVLLGFGGAIAAPLALVAALPPHLRHDAAPFTAAHVVLIGILAAHALRKGTRATGRVTTRWLIRGLFLLDGASLGAGGLLDAKVVAIFGGLFALYVGGAQLLFRPPSPTAAAKARLPDAGQL